MKASFKLDKVRLQIGGYFWARSRQASLIRRIHGKPGRVTYFYASALLA
jgi:hypothetical protein